MIPYILLFIFTSFLYFQSSLKKVSIGFYLLLFGVIFISGLRDMIGGYDVYVYAEVYESPSAFIIGFKPFEIGFRLYYLFLRIFSTDRYFMFFITAIIITTFHFFAIKKHSTILYFSIFLIFCKFFLMSFVYLRQGIAMGIIWFSFPYIINRNYLKFSLIVFVAFLFHKSAVIFIPIYFLASIKFENLKMFLIAVVAIIISVSPLSAILLGALAESSGDEKANIYVSLSSDVNIFYFIEVILLIILVLKFRLEFYKTKYGTLVINGLFGYIILNIMSLTNASFIRFGWYYFFFLILALPCIYNFIQDKKSKGLFKLAVFVYYSFIFFRLLIIYDDGDFMPYKSIFEDFNRNSRWENFEYR